MDKVTKSRADNLFLLLGAWRLSAHLLEVCIPNISKFCYLGVSLALIRDFAPELFVNKKRIVAERKGEEWGATAITLTALQITQHCPTHNVYFFLPHSPFLLHIWFKPRY